MYVMQEAAEADSEMDYLISSLSSDSDSSTQMCSSDVSMLDAAHLSDDGEIFPNPAPELLQTYLEVLTALHTSRYLQDREEISKTSINMTKLLNEYKYSRPAIFRQYLRVSPCCFDALLAAISNDPVFSNNSNNEQLPIETQLAVALYRFGHYGNGASILEVALWASIGYGSVDLVTRRVIRAVCSADFRQHVMRWPNEAEVHRARDWVQARSCAAWRGGWLMVDGTLVPLFQ
jgi:hypothetical protein